MAVPEEPTPTADETTAVAAGMARTAAGGPEADGTGGAASDLAGEPGTMSERAVAGRRGDDPADDAAPDDPADEAP